MQDSVEWAASLVASDCSTNWNAVNASIKKLDEEIQKIVLWWANACRRSADIGEVNPTPVVTSEFKQFTNENQLSSCTVFPTPRAAQPPAPRTNALGAGKCKLLTNANQCPNGADIDHRTSPAAQRPPAKTAASHAGELKQVNDGSHVSRGSKVAVPLAAQPGAPQSNAGAFKQITNNKVPRRSEIDHKNSPAAESPASESVTLAAGKLKHVTEESQLSSGAEPAAPSAVQPVAAQTNALEAGVVAQLIVEYRCLSGAVNVNESHSAAQTPASQTASQAPAVQAARAPSPFLVDPEKLAEKFNITKRCLVILSDVLKSSQGQQYIHRSRAKEHALSTTRTLRRRFSQRLTSSGSDESEVAPKRRYQLRETCKEVKYVVKEEDDDDDDDHDNDDDDDEYAIHSAISSESSSGDEGVHEEEDSSESEEEFQLRSRHRHRTPQGKSWFLRKWQLALRNGSASADVDAAAKVDASADVNAVAKVDASADLDAAANVGASAEVDAAAKVDVAAEADAAAKVDASAEVDAAAKVDTSADVDAAATVGASAEVDAAAKVDASVKVSHSMPMSPSCSQDKRNSFDSLPKPPNNAFAKNWQKWLLASQSHLVKGSVLPSNSGGEHMKNKALIPIALPLKMQNSGSTTTPNTQVVPSNASVPRPLSQLKSMTSSLWWPSQQNNLMLPPTVNGPSQTAVLLQTTPGSSQSCGVGSTSGVVKSSREPTYFIGVSLPVQYYAVTVKSNVQSQTFQLLTPVNIIQTQSAVCSSSPSGSKLEPPVSSPLQQESPSEPKNS